MGPPSEPISSRGRGRSGSVPPSFVNGAAAGCCRRFPSAFLLAALVEADFLPFGTLP